jgi:hypothetical protein
MNNQTPQNAARNFSQKMISQGYVPTGLQVYSDPHSNPIFWRIRLKNPITGEKVIWPMHQGANGEYVLKEPPIFAEQQKPIYRQPDIFNRPDEIVYIHEGEACADAFSKLGFVATTSGGWNSADKADWSLLKSRDVVIWPDADENGARYAENVTRILLEFNCNVWIVDIEKLSLPPKGDCIQWLEGKPVLSEDDIKLIKEAVFSLPLIEAKQTNNGASHKKASFSLENEDDSKDTDFNKTSMLLELMEDVDFFHDERKMAYASFQNNGHTETWLIESSQFKDWLAHQFWKVNKKSVHDAALRDALSVMKGKAIFEGNCHKVFMRVGSLNNKTYINLANEQWQVIEVSSDGWRILNESPVKFRVTQNMRSLPLPIQHGNVGLLWQHVNIPASAQQLILAWMLDCLMPDTPFPLLVLTGLQGSGKSRTQELIRNLIDPSMPNLRGAPKNPDDILIAAANNWLVSYNNVSKLSVENQDDLCCLSTGGGFARRRLYTTDEESVIDIKRPVIMNGIGDLITRQDLIDRCVIIDLPSINETNRKAEAELDADFMRDYPAIFGGLLDVFSQILKILPSIKLSTKPRMASFALLGTALEEILHLDQGSFTQEYRGNYQDNMLSALDGSPVAVALIKFMSNQNDYCCTYGELLTKLSSHIYRPEMAGWPKSAKGLANILKRQAPALAVVGIMLIFDEKPRSDGYHVTIIKQKLMYE